jgi:hypothetical protein
MEGEGAGEEGTRMHHLEAAHVLGVSGKLDLLPEQPPDIQHNPAHHVHIAAVITAISAHCVTIAGDGSRLRFAAHSSRP